MARKVELVLVSSVLMLSLLLAGCPKRPAPSPVATSPPIGTPSPASPGAQAPAKPKSGGPTPAAAAAPKPLSSQPAPKEFRPIAALKDIQFDFDKYDIRPSDAKILDENAKWMKVNANYLVVIEGHCDERGTNEYNLALGERRAKATMNYLIAQGIQAARMTIISYGEERPACAEKTEGCWAKNRRAHFLIKE